MAGFGFTRAPDQNGEWTNPVIWIVFLIPDVAPAVGAFTVTPTGGSAQAMSDIGDWGPATSQSHPTFSEFLGLTQFRGPDNPVSAFLPGTQALAAGTTYYNVYQAEFGDPHFGPTTDPTFTTSLSPPAGTVVFAYITDDSGRIMDSTASGGALLVNGAVPEPASVIGVGTVLLLMGCLARKKFSRPAV